MSLINDKTKLRIKDSEGSIVHDFIDKMNVYADWQGMRKLFLLDIRNCFLKGLAHS